MDSDQPKQNDIYYFKRKAQKQQFDQFIKDGSNVSNYYELLITFQGLLLDNQMGVILNGHPKKADLQAAIQEYEAALDRRARAEIEQIFLDQSEKNLISKVAQFSQNI